MIEDSAPVDYLIDRVHSNPGEDYPGPPPRDTRFADPAVLAEHDYSGQVVGDGYLQFAATFDRLEGGGLPTDCAVREAADAFADQLQADVDAATDAGIAPYGLMDLFVLPEALLEQEGDAILGDAVGTETGAGSGADDGQRIALTDRTKALHRAMFAELFERFPDLAGVVVRTGENYATRRSPHYVGNEAVPLGEESKRAEKERFVPLLQFLREAICEAHDRQLVFRTWDTFPDRFHSSPEYYRDVTDRVEPHPNLYFAIKHTRTDFWRYTGFNPCIAIGEHEQIVEVQCQREYEGKGAFPNYVADGVIDGFPEDADLVDDHALALREDRDWVPGRGLESVLDDPQIRGVCTWSRGGGWDGPYVTDETWPALNLAVVARFANGDEREESAIFHDVVQDRLGLSATDAELFREAVDLAEAGLSKGRYCAASDREASAWCVTGNWLRDDVLGGYRQLEGVFDRLVEQGAREAAIAEKREAVEQWERACALIGSVHVADPEGAAAIDAQFEYGRRLFTAIAHGWTCLAHLDRHERGEDLDRAAARESIEDFEQAWTDYRKWAENTDAAATVFGLRYRNDTPGLGASIERLRELCDD